MAAVAESAEESGKREVVQGFVQVPDWHAPEFRLQALPIVNPLQVLSLGSIDDVRNQTPVEPWVSVPEKPRVA
jgi:hypothetical protein